MRIIGISVEEGFLQAAIMLGDHKVYWIKNREDRTVFRLDSTQSGTEKYRRALETIQLAAKWQYDIEAEGAVFAIPLQMTLKERFEIQQAAWAVGMKRNRFMDRGEAQALRLAVMGRLPKVEKVGCIMLGYGEKKEKVWYEYSSDVLEICLLEDAYTNRETAQAYEALLIPGEGRSIVCGFEPAAVKDDALRKSLTGWTKEALNPVSGAAMQAAKMMDDSIMENILLLAVSGFEIRIGEKKLISADCNVPEKKSCTIEKKRLTGKWLPVIFERHGKEEAYRFDISPLQGQTLQVTAEFDAGKKIFLHIEDETGNAVEYNSDQAVFYANPGGDGILRSEGKGIPEEVYIGHLIEIGDDLYNGIRYLKQKGEVSSAEGIEKILTGKIDVFLAEYGIVPFTSTGTIFDPERHNAVGHFSEASLPANFIMDEYRRGYFKQGKLYRAADVVVVN